MYYGFMLRNGLVRNWYPRNVANFFANFILSRGRENEVREIFWNIAGIPISNQPISQHKSGRPRRSFFQLKSGALMRCIIFTPPKI